MYRLRKSNIYKFFLSVTYTSPSITILLKFIEIWESEYWIYYHLMLRTLLSKSLHDASLLWLFLSRQLPTIQFKQISRFQNIRILWHANWNNLAYCSRIPKDEKTKFWNENSNYMMKNYVRGIQKFVRFRWLFELCEFELKEFSCKGLLVNSDKTKKFVRFRWSFELQEFELHRFNCNK